MNKTPAAADPWHYPRPRLAAHYLDALDLGLQSARGLFAKRRMGKTEFLTKDLLPAAKDRGYLTAYANLWDDRSAPTRVLVAALTSAAKPRGMLARVAKTLKSPIKKVRAGGKIPGLAEGHLEADLFDEADLDRGLRGALAERDKTKKKFLLVVDEAQVLSGVSHGTIAHTLRAALDVRKETVKVIFAGSSESTLRRMFGRTSEPFYNWAPLEPFELLGRDFVQSMVGKANALTKHPIKLPAALAAFAALDNTPDYFRTFLDRYLTHALDGVDAALEHTRSVVYTNREFQEQWHSLLAADQQLLRMLANGATDLHGKAARTKLGDILGVDTPVKPSTVQNALVRLQANTILTKMDHGEYEFEDDAFAHWIRNRGT